MEEMCRLCFIVENEVITFFSEESEQLDIANIVVQHFWFKISRDDNLPKGICQNCWKHVFDFHNFYKNIETLHKRRSLADIQLKHLNSTEYCDVAGINFLNVEDDDFNIKSEFIDTHYDHQKMLLGNHHNDETDVKHIISVKLENEIVSTNEFDGSVRRRYRQSQSSSKDDRRSIKPQAKTIKKKKNFRKKTSKAIKKCFKSIKITKNQTTSNCKKELSANIKDENAAAKEKEYEIQSPIVEDKKPIICKNNEIAEAIVNNNNNIDGAGDYKDDKNHFSDDGLSNNDIKLEYDDYNRALFLLSTNDEDDILANNIDTECDRKRNEEDAKIKEFFNLSCPICSLELSTIVEVRAHVRMVHNLANGHILCCKKKLFRRCDLLEHINWHSNPNEFKCEVCHKVYRNKHGLKIHMHFHSKPEERQFRCDICDDSFTVRYHLMRHFRITHFKKTTKEYRCNYCDKCFRENSILQSHIRAVHECKNVHICHICAKVYKSKSQCELHFIAEHTNQVKPKIQCQLCGALLKNELSLNCHLRRTHNGVPKTCKLCGKIAPHKNALQSHMRYVHAERIHKCNICDKAFKKPIGLKEHIATHTGTSILYTCSYCPKTFNSNANMHSHRKKKHPVEWLAERFKRQQQQ